jgi:murein DD-endopeptidase MepM/ murein hydrolase activator NlpD
MDEILRMYDEQDETALSTGEPVHSAPHSGRLFRAAAVLRDGLSHAKQKAADALRREEGISNSHPILAPLAFLMASAAIGAAVVAATLYTPCYTVTVDGQILGNVKEPAVYEEAVHRVEERASQILGYSYTLNQDAEYSFTFAEKTELTPAVGLETYLFDQVDEVISAYVLKVGDRLIGAAPSEGTLTALLTAISAPYENENTVSTSFLQPVYITREDISANTEQSIERMNEILTANTNGETQYVVQAGDTFMQIAYDNDMDMADLQALNPQQDINKLFIGQVLTIRETIPFLSVKTVENQTYQEAIPSPVEEVEDATMYKGESKVLNPGTEGMAQVTAVVTFENGRERERTVVSTAVLTEPTTRVVAVGTKERPTWLPTGRFAWPTWGRITSSFGTRYIFGSYSYHSGIDISVPYGSSVKAADGGTVVFAGTGSGSTWSYGKYVVIDHGNGKQTYYAHNSSLLVSAGDKVYQGQAIAKAGSTGRSTGTHCHFQVKINGGDVNPLKYLP